MKPIHLLDLLVLGLALGSPLPLLAQTNAPLTGEMTRPVVRQVPAAGVPAAGAAAIATPVPASAAAAPIMPAAPQTVVQPAASTMQAPRSATAAASVPASVPRPRIRSGGGASTRTLLAAQASGRIAGAERPMLGATATLAWERYLNSFKHPIPEWFEATVEEGN